MLRTDHFPTNDRASTRFIVCRDTLTPPDPEIDILELDTIHCRKGRIGVGFHFVILPNGTIQLGRRISSTGCFAAGLDQIAVGVGLVGGLVENPPHGFKKGYTRTPEQSLALTDLIEVLRDIYPGTLLDP
jgi:hypothetical protein